MISIIIPTYNEENDILGCLNSLNKQTYKDFEIIIVDDGSTDKTISIINKLKKKDSKIKVLRQEHLGPGIARNLGARNAKGKILVFIDADMIFDKNYLKNLIKPIKNGLIGTTHSIEIAKNTENIWSRCWGKLRVSNAKGAYKVKIFRAIRKKEFLKMGGFDPKYGYADDQTFWFRDKLKPIMAKNTICYHKNPETLKKVYKQSKWIGASIDNILLETLIIKHILPFLLVLFCPIIIPILALRKCYKNKDFSIFPQTLIFMLARYFGTISGIIRKVYLNLNVR